MKMQYVRLLIVILLLLTSVFLVTKNALAQTFPSFPRIVPGWGNGDFFNVHIGPPGQSVFPSFPPRPSIPPRPTFPPIQRPTFPPRPSFPGVTFPPFPTIPPQQQ